MFKKDVLIPLLLNKVGKVILLILLGSIAITYFFIGSNLFVVKKIEILNSKLIDERSFLRWNGKNIFLVPVATLTEKIDEIPEVKSIVIRKELPSKLTIEIQEYVPCAFLNQSNSLLAVSKEGVIFPSKEKVTEINGYPSVIYEDGNDKEELLKNKKPWPGLAEAMGAYLSVKDIVPIGMIKVKKDNDIFLYTRNGKTEIRINGEEYEKETDYFRILMKELPSKNVEYIDLRFGGDIPVKP